MGRARSRSVRRLPQRPWFYFGAVVLLVCSVMAFARPAWSAEDLPRANAWVTAPPQLGVTVRPPALTAQQARANVFPDGRGLPEGSGSAVEGALVYEKYCLACHGQNGKGALNLALVGGEGTLASGAPVRTVGSYWPYATTLFDYIRRAMPYTAAGTLSNDQVYAVTAYLLQLNAIVEPTLTLDAANLPRIQMPNRDGFDWPETVSP